MKKVMLIMAAALMTMTQCRKQETVPVTPAADTMKMTITAGPGRTDINTATGAITWSAGDKLYVSDGTNWLGCLTLVGEGGSAQGTFTGSIAGIDESETTCHFFYLGHDNGMAEPTGTAAASISFAAQDGTLAGAMKYHTGYGSTDVTVQDGEYAGYVIMGTKIAIAHINFTTDGTSDYTGSLTMGGTGIFNTLSVSPDGTFSGSGDGGIVIGGTTGERYVTLIPTTGTDRVDVSFTGDATGSMNFLAGIRENKFYGMKDAIAVTLEASAPVFSVAAGTTVEFAPGNLYWDGSSWQFEANQWDFRTYAGKNSCIAGSVKTDGTPNGHWGLFGWSTSATTYGMSTSQNNDDYSGDFNDWGGLAIGDYEANTWRTLTKNEWSYLLGDGDSFRTDASSLRAWVTLEDVNVSGLVILPDGTEYPLTVLASITETTDLATYNAVFLPAAGFRYDTSVRNVGSFGFYWSSSYNDSNSAYYLNFNSGSVSPSFSSYRYNGFSVRLVSEN